MSNVFVKNPNPPIGLTPSENICFGSFCGMNWRRADVRKEFGIRH